MPSTQSGSGKHPNLDDLLPISEAAERSGLSESYIRRLVGQGRIWGIKPGRNWLTTMKAVREYIARKTGPGRPKTK